MKKKIYKQSEIFWISDPHFYHEACIKFFNRPFSSLQEMHEVFIKNWNDTVKKTDTIIIDGDFAFTGNKILIEELLNSLNGIKILIPGNHCIKNKFDRESIKILFTGGVYQQLEVLVEDEDAKDGIQSIFNSHYPCISWPKSGYGSWHTFGHIHSRPGLEEEEAEFLRIYKTMRLKSYDVGVDNNEFIPTSYFKLKIKVNE